MEYFNFIEDKKNLFYKFPESFNLMSDKAILSHALGATLYMGGDRKSLLNDILSTKAGSVVICLEDSVAKVNLKEAEENVLSVLAEIEARIFEDMLFLEEIPLLFIRVRNNEQFESILSRIKTKGLCGFVFPKFTYEKGLKYFKVLKNKNQTVRRQENRVLYGMPILETPEVIFKETRVVELLKLKEMLDCFKEMVLNIRIGGTDLSGLYGLRRAEEFTIYDISVIRDFMADVINIFKREDYVVSGPVCEYYDLPFDISSSALVRETKLDLANGFLGKTSIHPRQVNIINSLMVVTKEAFLDAEAIFNSKVDGVIRSTYSNKMNEINPHFKWAKNTILLSKIMGVLQDGKYYKDIFNFSNEIYLRQESRITSRYS